MLQHDFGELHDKYDAVIDQMPAVFTTHQFILRLAQQNQRLYIDALDGCRHEEAPFRMVHAALAVHLTTLQCLEQLPHVASTDIFGGRSECAQWHKV
jgi:hypothetical protein